MYEYTVTAPFPIMTADGLRQFQPGEHITDPALFERLESPEFHRNVSRHAITSAAQDEARQAQDEAREAAEKAAGGGETPRAPQDAKSIEKAATGRRGASQADKPAPDTPAPPAPEAN